MTPSTRDCFFTSIALNYLSKALALAESVFAVYPGTRMVISVIDHRWLSAAQRESLDAIVRGFAERGARLEFLDPLAYYDRPDLFRYKFSVVEACTAVKPAVASALLAGADTVTYLDPDTFLYAPLPAHPDAADAWDVQLTPHALAPARPDALISERLFMLYGTFNLGYFAVRRTDAALGFLAWWKQFCVDYGVDAPQAGLFVDQKPVDLLPSFVDRVSMLRHPGCNMAWWNVFCDGRALEADGRTVSFAGERSPLVFFHFSNLDREPDPARRLVANPLRDYVAPGRPSPRMADHPAIERLFAHYEARCAEWSGRLGGLKVAHGLEGRAHDAPRMVRMLLSEALRRGMDHPGDPFERSARSVAWDCISHVRRHLSRKDVRAALGAIRNAARLSLTSPRVLRPTH